MPVQIEKDTMPPVNEGEMHVAVAIAADASSSLSGRPIQELNQGLVEFGIALQNDPLAMGRAEITIISFNSTVQTEMSFRPAENYEAPVLTATGLTSFNGGIEAALDALEARKEVYKNKGIKYYRPWLFVLTDGAPTDSEKEEHVKSRLRSAIENKKVTYIPMGIGEGANIKKLQEYYPEDAEAKPVLKATATNFKEAFQWLSASIGVAMKSDPRTTSAIQTPPLPSSLTLGI
ncbi:MAG: VWA domain-containing protein [Ruminococcaceae bacterium]|nr:VWA domain-containing protein [Oscillospiraceae bacterium]